MVAHPKSFPADDELPTGLATVLHKLSHVGDMPLGGAWCPLPPGMEIMRVGDWRLSKHLEFPGKIWIQVPSGEGFHVSAESLERKLEQLFEEEF